MTNPKISIVTPSFNQGQYLEQTILSVLDQGYPNLEYILIDGGSTDNSIDIIKKYEHKLSYWVSEPDNGMYYALQKGFAKTTGEIMGWLNSDDMLHKNSLFSIAEILSIKGVNWIEGMPNVFDEAGRCVYLNDNGRWSQLRHLKDNVCIQQDCTYWRRELWEKAGGYISTEYSLAGDFELWHRFFKYEKLFTPKCLTGGFRTRSSGQLSSNGNKYFMEVTSILETDIKSTEITQKINRLKKLERIKRIISKTRLLNIFFISSRIDKRTEILYDYPPTIYFSTKEQKFILNEKEDAI